MAGADLDPFDRKILRLLQTDNAVSQRDIAAAGALSPAAVHRRIRRLEADGVITANVAVVAPERVGRPLTLVVGVSVESERAAALEETKRLFAAAPEVQQCYYVTGDFDFILVLTAADMSEYERLTTRLFSDHANVARFRTFVVMDRTKATLAAPL
jgi:DNA-binding Lrp family transcriptional regulator